MDTQDIKNKFGDEYKADEYTFIMGIDRRFTSHFANRFAGFNVLETCTGAGFTAIQLAKTAKRLVTVEISESHQRQAKSNIELAGLSEKVTFIKGSILDQELVSQLPPVDAAFLDPDWAVTGPDHQYRFVNSNTQPPADLLLNRIFTLTQNVALVLPPFIDPLEFRDLPDHERETLYMDENPELFCLYFGNLKNKSGSTEYRV